MESNEDFDRLAARVRVAARDGGLIETAQVKLVGLEEVREAAGLRWPRMRAHVREGSLKIISARLGPDDAAMPCGDGFLIVFADAGSAESERRCADIRDALVAFYLGEDALRQLRAEVAPEKISAAHLANMVSAPQAAAPRQSNELKLGRFWPVWSARRQGVAAYLCTPILERPQAPARMCYDPDFAEKAVHASTDYLDLDLCLLEQAFEAAEETAGAAIGVTVHVTTLQSRRTRNLYLKHMKAGAALTKQRMFITIAEIPPGTPLMSMTEWTNVLKQVFPRVALELHRTDRALAGLSARGAWAAGYHVASQRNASAAQVRTALNELDNCCRVLRRQGVQSFMHGFIETSFFDLASFSEIGFATGEALGACQTAPPSSPLMAA